MLGYVDLRSVLAVMTSHLLLPQVDPGTPATFSRRILTGLLREEHHVDGGSAPRVTGTVRSVRIATATFDQVGERSFQRRSEPARLRWVHAAPKWFDSEVRAWTGGYESEVGLVVVLDVEGPQD